jgi:glycosyltransferase involved in cell wall biosynthesis
VADEWPWPERSGYRIRLANVLRGLARLGAVDLLVLHGEGAEVRTDAAVPAGEPVGTVRSAPLPAPVRTRSGLLRWWRGDLPRRVAWRDWTSARDALDAVVAEGYDLVWWSHLDTWIVLGERSAAPAIVDLDNLEDAWLAGRRAVGRRSRSASRLRALVASGLDAVDARRWRRWQDRAATTAAAALVCTEDDLARVGGPRVRILRNGYPTPDHPVGHPDRAVPEAGGVVAFVGLQTYEPNVDAARFLVDEVLPRLRVARPAVAIRLIGRAGPEVERLGAPGVEVLGEVEDLDAALAPADLIAVPIRFGGGTRIKVLEAMAHRIPIVSTSLGCAGLGLRDGVEVTIADDAAAFAAACARLLADRPLRESRATAAARTHAARFEWTVIAEDVVGIAREALAVSA